MATGFHWQAEKNESDFMCALTPEDGWKDGEDKLSYYHKFWIGKLRNTNSNREFLLRKEGYLIVQSIQKMSGRRWF